MKRIIFFMLIIAFSGTIFAEESPQIPQYFNYSGSLTDDGGNLLPDGTKNIRFKIVNSAGGIIFEETQDVEIIKGEISAIVGNGINPSSGAPSAGIPAESIEPNDTLFFQIEIDGERTYDPMEIVSSPYAIWADTALKMPDESITSAMLGKGIITKDHLDQELAIAIFPEGVPKALLPSDTVYTNSIQSFAGASKVGVAADFIYSGSQTVQGVLKDFDMAVKKRQQEAEWIKSDYVEQIGAEALARKSEDGIIKNQIENETTERKEADTSIQNQIGVQVGAEASVRQSEDNEIKNQLGAHSVSTTVHGIVGNVVGTTDEQTLSNKTITSTTLEEPILVNPVINGEISGEFDGALPPIGSIIPFYDFDGALAFDFTRWKYCDGTNYDFGGNLGVKTLPDMSGRYLVGFGGEGGGNLGTAAWEEDAVGNISHEIDLKHNHPNTLSTDAPGTTIAGGHSHVVNAHSHSHNHTVNSHSHTLTKEGAHAHGGMTAGMSANATHKLSTYEVYDDTKKWSTGGPYLSVSEWPLQGHHDHDISQENSHTHTIGEMTSNTSKDETKTSPNTNSTGDHTHAVNHTHTITNAYAFSSAQSIQPRSIRVRYIMRVK